MQVNLRSILESILIVIIGISWCELAYYHYVFYTHCPSWPGMEASDGEGHENLTKLIVIADTHIMGPIKSFKIDKWRREWQMKQAFSISTSIYKPDIVVFMGDLLDEGLTSHEELFKRSCNEFEDIFPPERNGAERIIIPGNHDVGIHDRMLYFPFLIERFRDRFRSTSSVELIQTPCSKHLNLVVSNSMSLYNDSCPHCTHSLSAINQIERRLGKIRATDASNYSPPIFLGHIPLFRKNDLNCIFPESLRGRVAKDNIEGDDVLHKVASQTIKEKIKPRLAISGHTHMECLTGHQVLHNSKEVFQEITVTSYNHKYAELEPGFLLLTVGSRQYHFKHCKLISEWVVIAVYVATLMVAIFSLVSGHRRRWTQVVSQSRETLRSQ